MEAPPFVPAGPLSVSTHAEVEKFIAAQIPDGKHGALVGVADTTGVTFALAARIGDSDRWQLAGDVSRRWDGDVSGHVYVAGSW